MLSFLQKTGAITGSKIRKVEPLLSARYYLSTSVTNDNNNNANHQPPEVTLYQYNICPFCHKAKALLSYANIPYQTVEVNPLTKGELKPWSGDYRKVPIAIIDGKQINGSDKIVDELLQNDFVSKFLQTKKWNNDGDMECFAADPTAVKWVEFAQKDLAALLYPNICSSISDSYQAFNYVHNVPEFSTMQRYSIQGIGSLAMYFAASKIKSKRGITDEKEALNNALSLWEAEGLENGKKKYSSGKSYPSMGDIAVFGTLWSVDGLIKAIPEDKVTLLEWYERMKMDVTLDKA